MFLFFLIFTSIMKDENVPNKRWIVLAKFFHFSYPKKFLNYLPNELIFQILLLFFSQMKWSVTINIFPSRGIIVAPFQEIFCHSHVNGDANWVKIISVYYGAVILKIHQSRTNWNGNRLLDLVKSTFYC